MFELFVSEYCPYCRKVITFLQENDIDYIEKDVSDKQNFDKLVSLGGKDQVPFLNDSENNVLMYESDDIIEYVKKLQE